MRVVWDQDKGHPRNRAIRRDLHASVIGSHEHANDGDYTDLRFDRYSGRPDNDPAAGLHRPRHPGAHYIAPDHDGADLIA